MNTNLFQKAQRQRVKLKLAITGPAGSGKTTAALRLARGLTRNGRIAVIDTENRSASLYADLFEFDVLDLEPPFEDRKFSEGITAAVAAGYDAVILDSGSHFWEAVLDYKDKLDKRGGNSFSNWSEATRRFRGVLDAVLQSPIHVITCLRSKMDHVLEKDEKSGRQVVKKVGMAPIMRDGVEYEFTVVLDLDMGHQAVSSKDRTRLFDGRIFEITEATGQSLREWLDSGAATPPPQPFTAPEPAPAPPPATAEQVQKITLYWQTLKKEPGAVPQALAFAGAPAAQDWPELTEPQAAKLIAELQRQMNALAARNQVAEPAAPLVDPKVAAPPADEVPMDYPSDLAGWFEGHEQTVNEYLCRVNWINPGQTWRDLTPEKVAQIKERRKRFASAAAIPLPAGEEVAA
ncbi:MAG: ATP-binding protein [Verrucomicrobiales bacterium]|nr:ATP-binding protein [Verrucomicrobiales bacterium]